MPPIIGIARSGDQMTAKAANSNPIMMPLSAPCHAARAQPSLPVTFSTVRSAWPTIAMSRAGTSCAMSVETAFCAPSYLVYVATVSPTSGVGIAAFNMLMPRLSHVATGASPEPAMCVL